MSNVGKLTKKDILHLAKLANIELSDNEIEKYATQLTETLLYIENLKELDTQDIAPTSQTVNLTNITFTDGAMNKRKLTKDEALKNAKRKKDDYFEVDKII